MTTDRDVLIRALCEERGSWGDGSEATEISIRDAARYPYHYDIDPDDLDGACAGDVAAIARLRRDWGLQPFC